MAPPEPRRRLIVNADDFGRSRSINEAVIRAHRDGILTTASLMVTGEAADEAVRLARENPRLGIGLHLTLVCGRSALAPEAVPHLADRDGRFGSAPAEAALRYLFQPGLRESIEREVAAQFERFRATGLPLDHVDGHLHFHLHPAVFPILVRRGSEWGIRCVRLTRDPLWLNLRLARGRWGYRLGHWLVFSALAASWSPAVRRTGLRHTARVFGLLQDSRVNQEFVEALVHRLPPGDSELYSHPSLVEFKHELDALIAPAVRAAIERRGIELIRHAEL